MTNKLWDPGGDNTPNRWCTTKGVQNAALELVTSVLHETLCELKRHAPTEDAQSRTVIHRAEAMFTILE